MAADQNVNRNLKRLLNKKQVGRRRARPPPPKTPANPMYTVCEKCPCYAEEVYYMPKKLRPCLKTPLTLYELAAIVVDRLKFPNAFNWKEKDVAKWMEHEVGLPRYKACIYDNHINGRRLLMLEDPSVLPEINIHDFEHIKVITRKVRELYGTDWIEFSRSIGLPPRRPLVHCTWFKSRTGPSWGIRRNWSRSDILRWMKILAPAPVYMDHWDLVWYHKPDFPATKFARVPDVKAPRDAIPHYVPPVPEPCLEHLEKRKFCILQNIDEEFQYIWVKNTPKLRDILSDPEEERLARLKAEKRRDQTPHRLMPKRVSLTGLKGDQLLLARRKRPTPKFAPA